MRPRSLWPREHGAYVQLGAPLIVALASAPSVAGAAIATGAALAFVAHEPWLVVSGARGPRARREHEALARRRLVACGATSLIAGGLGLGLAPASIPAGLAALAAALVVVALSWRGVAHTLAGEVVAAAALAGAALPVAIAGGAPWSRAVDAWAAWSLGFAATVVAVHAVITSHKRRARPASWIVGLGATGAAIALASLSAAAPLWLAATAATIVRPPATRLRAIGVGFTIVAAGSAAAMLLSG